MNATAIEHKFKTKLASIAALRITAAEIISFYFCGRFQAVFCDITYTFVKSYRAHRCDHKAAFHAFHLPHFYIHSIFSIMIRQFLLAFFDVN